FGDDAPAAGVPVGRVVDGLARTGHKVVVVEIAAPVAQDAAQLRRGVPVERRVAHVDFEKKLHASFPLVDAGDHRKRWETAATSRRPHTPSIVSLKCFLKVWETMLQAAGNRRRRSINSRRNHQGRRRRASRITCLADLEGGVASESFSEPSSVTM